MRNSVMVPPFATRVIRYFSYRLSAVFNERSGEARVVSDFPELSWALSLS
jgi:hypothetical protein